MDSKVVTATRSEQQLTDTAAAAYVISQDDIRRSGATTIPEALRMVPGLHVAQISSTKWAISARGFNGLIADKLLVLMDGRSLYSPIHKGVFWEIQDRVLDDIERIEIIRGPGASVWGANASNGVINIITKHSADTKEGSVTLFGGDKYGAGLRKGWQFTDQGYARVYGKFLRDESFANKFGNDANEEWTSGRGGFRVDWANADGKHALMAQGDVYYGIYDENNAKRIKEDKDDTTGQDYQALINGFESNRVAKKGGNILARWNYNQSLASRMSAQFFYDTFQENQAQNRSVESETFDWDFQHVLALNEAHELTWGLNYRLSLVQLKPFQGDENTVTRSEYFPKTFQNNRFSALFQDKWRWNEDLEITFGSKFEHHNNNNFEIEPSIRLLWKAANQLIVPLFLRKIFPGSCSKNQQKLRGSQCLRLPQPSCYTRFMPNKGHKTGCAMTRRDVGMLCNSTPQTALRGIAQPYRFWGLKIFTPLTLRFHDFQRSSMGRSFPRGKITFSDRFNIVTC
ncbi:TonB-dependent receptor plug domain-containing protein [Methyloglobulus sp.]|uniref:TonB-dependent receptor plug domain-containing protein n=1 Tax=Methyloglobulus sp. TaxID=2518622 RepID=UPI0032B77236